MVRVRLSLLAGSFLIAAISRSQTTATVHPSALNEAIRAETAKKVPEVCAAINAQLKAGNWEKAERGYASVAWAKPDAPCLIQAKARLLPILRRNLLEGKELQKARARALEEAGVKKTALLSSGCDALDTAVCFAKFGLSEACIAVCGAAGQCSQECKDCISQLVDNPYIFATNCHPCLFGDCYHSAGGAFDPQAACFGNIPTTPRIGDPRPRSTGARMSCGTRSSSIPFCGPCMPDFDSKGKALLQGWQHCYSEVTRDCTNDGLGCPAIADVDPSIRRCSID